ncbi:hypothetical protein JCGZ_24089 [Jatropha curcas]|uniref:RNase H type-1 domain-containing protein n=1 Tax=Jatropha curcas TaxID=180498 RepID=A0A067LPQ5_JATCU|nr:hypothetical protein JCGZ_24089 [Jatropha curcas]
MWWPKIEEYLAIRAGVLLAWERGFCFLIVETDSLKAIRLVASILPSSHPLAAIVMDVQGLLL